MNIQQPSYFSTAVDTSSFKETAQTHFVTPAAISKALGDLETELGIELFVKEGRAIVPTEKALLLKPLADNISRNVKEFERLAKLPKEKSDTPRTFILAAAYAPARSKLINREGVEALKRLDPQRRILVVRRDSGSCLSAVIEGSVDAALILGEPKSDSLTSARVGTSQSIVVVNKSNPLANLTTISPNDLRSVAVGWPHDIRYALPLLLDLFDKSDVEPHFTHLYTIEDNTQFISEDKGCLIATNEPYIASTYPNAAFLPFADEEADVPVFLVWKKEDNDPLLEELTETLEAILKRR